MINLDAVENEEKFEEHFSKITSARQKSKSIFTDLQKKPNMMNLLHDEFPSLLFLSTSPFDQAPYPKASKEVGGEASYLQDEEGVSSFSQSQFPQMRVEMLSPQNYSHIHPVIKKLLHVENMQNFQPAKHLRHFLKNWEKLTKDPFILELVKGYQILFLSEPFQTAPPRSISMSQEETGIVNQEIQEMLKKGAIKLVQPNTDNLFLSSIFILPKKDSGHHPVMNLKKLNKHIPYIHFKMQSLFLLNEILFLKGITRARST